MFCLSASTEVHRGRQYPHLADVVRIAGWLVGRAFPVEILATRISCGGVKLLATAVTEVVSLRHVVLCPILFAAPYRSESISGYELSTRLPPTIMRSVSITAKPHEEREELEYVRSAITALVLTLAGRHATDWYGSTLVPQFMIAFAY